MGTSPSALVSVYLEMTEKGICVLMQKCKILFQMDRGIEIFRLNCTHMHVVCTWQGTAKKLSERKSGMI